MVWKHMQIIRLAMYKGLTLLILQPMVVSQLMHKKIIIYKQLYQVGCKLLQLMQMEIYVLIFVCQPRRNGNIVL